MSLRTHWTRWRAHGAEYRKERRGWVWSELSRLRARWGLVPAALLAVAGPIVVWIYGRATGTETDVVGVALGAVAPLLILVLGALFWFRLRAPNAIYRRYKKFYDEKTPRSLFAVTGRVDDDGVTFELLPSTSGLPPPEVGQALAEANAFVVFDGHTATLKSGPLFPGSVWTSSPLTTRYPDDFDHAEWPLKPGKYHMVWQWKRPDGSGTIGWDFSILRRRS